MSRFLKTRSAVSIALAVTMCFALAACGDEDSSGKTVANTPTGDQTKLPAAPSVVAQREPTKERGNDVLDWLKMTPEKADKKPPEPPKPEQAKLDAKAVPAAPIPAPAAPAPVQVAVAQPIERPILQPVVASARETFNPTPVAAPPAAPAVALAAPVAPAAVPRPAAALKLIASQDPGFPREALRKGVTTGHVKARISVAADGSVSKVEVIESSPPRVFDGSVVSAVSHWRYAPVGEPTSIVTEFDFRGDE